MKIKDTHSKAICMSLKALDILRISCIDTKNENSKKCKELMKNGIK